MNPFALVYSPELLEIGPCISDDPVVLMAFHKWASRNLGQGYRLDREEGSYVDTVTRWAYSAFRGAWKLAGSRDAAAK